MAYSNKFIVKGTKPHKIAQADPVTEYDVNAPVGALVGIGADKKISPTLYDNSAKNAVTVKLREQISSAPKLGYIHHNASDATLPNAYLADRTNDRVCNCYFETTGNIGDTVTAYTSGEITGLTGLKPGETYYLDTAGNYTDTEPTAGAVQDIGIAESETVINFIPGDSLKL